MITLQPITWENGNIIANRLEVHESQKDFVASNLKSLAHAYVYWATSGIQPLVFGIYSDDTPVGFTMLHYETAEMCEHKSNEGQPCYGIWRFMIDKNHQGNGYGKAAMHVILKLLRTKPLGEAPAIYLSYHPDNVGARNLYKSVGFTETGEVDDDELVARLMF